MSRPCSWLIRTCPDRAHWLHWRVDSLTRRSVSRRADSAVHATARCSSCSRLKHETSHMPVGTGFVPSIMAASPAHCFLSKWHFSSNDWRNSILTVAGHPSGGVIWTLCEQRHLLHSNLDGHHRSKHLYEGLLPRQLRSCHESLVLPQGQVRPSGSHHS